MSDRAAVFGLILLLTTVLAVAGPEQAGWETLEPGLEFGRFEIPHPDDERPGVVNVLRIDPAHFNLRVMAASASQDQQPHTARGWAQIGGLAAAINASMFQEDFLSSVSLLRMPGHVNNPRLSGDNTVLAFDPKSDDLPAVRLIDRECDDFEAVSAHYRSLVQSIRMISCKGRNVWSPSEKRSSIALVAMDQADRLLFIHVRTPYSTHELINALLSLPLAIERAMYTEGGIQAQMYLKSGEVEREFSGAFGSGYPSSEGGPSVWPVPNVIGIVRRAP